MIKRTTIASLVLLFAATTLAANSGCSKSDKAEDKDKNKAKPTTTKQPDKKPVADKTPTKTPTSTTPVANTKLLALKFHHDN